MRREQEIRLDSQGEGNVCNEKHREEQDMTTRNNTEETDDLGSEVSSATQKQRLDGQVFQPMSDKKRAWEKVEMTVADIRVGHWNKSVTKGLDKGVVLRQGQTRSSALLCPLLLLLPPLMPASSISGQTPPPAPAPRRRASATPAHNAGVKSITRKVIHTLEGLGHLDPALEAEADVEEDDDEHEVARALAADADARRVGAGK
ncbi:hypothetical protein DFH09DRAFT_1367583 [Mycena vulgaris]|nr:hypothetical protein DFH09DRAFT_1367583 [Mycena vulgaris]